MLPDWSPLPNQFLASGIRVRPKKLVRATLWFLGGVVGLFLLITSVVGLANFFSGPRSTKLGEMDVEQGRTAPTNLVVLFHSFQGPSALKDLYAVVSEELPNSEIWRPDYARSIHDELRFLSNDDPFNIAAQLNERLEELYKQRKYEHIYLIGHGIGALLARKTFVYGYGLTEDDATIVSKPKRDWVSHVDRIILLAGMNRGWSLSPKPPKMSLVKKAKLWTAATLAQWSGTGIFIRSVERGMPFVANLRLQWLALPKLLPKLNPVQSVPPVYQLLGDYDDIVTTEDSADLITSGKSTYIMLHGTGHENMKEFEDSYDGKQRREKFRAALVKDTAELEKIFGPPNRLQQQKDVTDVVFLIHGIRTFGDWKHKVSMALQELAKRVNAVSSEKLKIAIATPSYGYFPLAPFLFGDREKYVKWFVDQYTEQRALFPEAYISLIAHSNGTYIAAKALENYSIELKRIVFAGSVVRRDYPWDQVIKRHQGMALRNDLAANDFIVGVGPGFFEWAHGLFGWGKAELGTGGFRGFLDNEGQRYETRYFKGVHSPAIECDDEDNKAACDAQLKSLADFVLTRDLDNGYKHPPDGIAQLLQPSADFLANWLSLFSCLVFPLLILLMLVAIWLIKKLVDGFIWLIGWPIKWLTELDLAKIVPLQVRSLCAFAILILLLYSV